MKKFQKANISDSEVLATARAWFVLYKDGDANTLKVVGDCPNDGEALIRLTKFAYESMRGTVHINDIYQVVRNDTGNGMVHLSIKRLDKTPCKDWRHFQKIKNELVGEECEAVEVYPAESKLVDCANQYHLWCWDDPEFRLPFGFQERMVTEQKVGKSQQRPFNEE